MLIRILAIAQRPCPCLIKAAVSKLNVEKVLKPPQNPMIISNLRFGFIEITSLIFIVRTKIRQAITLANSVAIGRLSDVFPTKIDNRYLNTEPNPPPIKTPRILHIIN